MSEIDMSCTSENIALLFFPENLNLSQPDAFMCRLHRQTFSTYKHALEHVQRSQDGTEQRQPVKEVL